ncbi:hypothetical protein I4U23_006698 [Adineta vaga]|nr:hypothetical protein I4U23_006698 [Adineta vaga]
MWHFYRLDTIDQMYRYELRQSDVTFQMKKIDFKSKLVATLNDQRRYLDFEHQNINIRSRNFPNTDQYLRHRLNDMKDGLSHHLNESAEQSQRPGYNLRRAVITDISSETSSTTSLQNLSIFSRSNSLLPPFGGIELQRSLSTTDIEQDIIDIQKSLCYKKLKIAKNSLQNQIDDTITKSSIDVRIEDGRLWYKRAWFSRNTPIFLIFDDLEYIPALVLTVGRNDLLVRRSGTNIKHRISLALLHDEHLTIRKRNF